MFHAREAMAGEEDMNPSAAAPSGAESNLDLALIGNCQISALVDRRGAVVWCCMPRFDSPSVFSSLLDSDQAGFWGIEPVESAGWETRQHYLRNTNVLVSQHFGPDNEMFEVIDFMPRFERF